MIDGGGALRAFEAYHPAARVHYVEFYGRTYWLTGKQLALWYQIMQYRTRGKRTTLKTMGDRAMCSRATVSRFLKRLDLWRVVDVATIRGRDGGTYILTIRFRNDEADANLSGARHTYVSRAIARARIARIIKRLKPMVEAYRKTLNAKPWYTRMGGGWKDAIQLQVMMVSTDATFR